MNTTRELRNGTIWTSINRFTVVGMQFLAMIVLARQLTPNDFALMGIISFFINISQIILDSGMAGFLVKKKNVSDIDYSTLFIFNVSVSLVVYIMFFLFSKTIASFYRIPELYVLINAAMISIIISAFGQIQNVILLRALRFKTIALISIFSSCIALLIAVLLAIKGYGVWALVWQNIILHATIVLLQFMNNRYFPRLVFSFSSFKKQWDFGVYLFVSQLLSTTYQNIFSMIFPKISSLSFSGMYAQANKIHLLPVSFVSSVLQSAAFPVLAKINDEEKFKSENRKYCRKIYTISFAVLFFMALFSKELIYFVLGEKWISSYHILSILSIGAVATVVITFVRITFKSRGLTRQIFQVELFRIVFAVFFLLLFLHSGDYLILVGIVCSQFFTMIVAMTILSRKSIYSIKEQIRDVCFSILPIILASSSLLMINIYIGPDSFLAFLLMSILYLFLILLGGYILKNREIISVIMLVLKYVRR